MKIGDEYQKTPGYRGLKLIFFSTNRLLLWEDGIKFSKAIFLSALAPDHLLFFNVAPSFLLVISLSLYNYLWQHCNV